MSYSDTMNSIISIFFTALISIGLEVDVCLAACYIPPISLKYGNCSFTDPNQNQISSWGVFAIVGNASASQKTCLMPSTASNTTLLTTTALCGESFLKEQNLTLPMCLNRRMGPVNLSLLPTTSPDGLDQLNPGWVVIMNGTKAFPSAANPPMQLGSTTVVMTSAPIVGGNNHAGSHLGLADRSVILDTLVSMGRIASRVWGFNAGQPRASPPREGSLVLGGWDKAAVQSPFTTYDMADYEHHLNRRVCPLQVAVEWMYWKQDGQANINLVTPTAGQRACIEPYDDLFRLPEYAIAEIKRNVYTLSGKNDEPIEYWTLPSDTAPPPAGADPRETLLYALRSTYVPEPGLIYPELPSNAAIWNATLVITLEKDFQVEFKAEEILRPARSIARDGRTVITRNLTELAVYKDPALGAAAILGKVFLSRAYLVVDLEKQQFKLAKVDPTANNQILIAADDDDNSCSADRPKWVIPVAVAIPVIAVLALAVVGYVVWRKRQRSHNELIRSEDHSRDENVVPEVIQIVPKPIEELPAGYTSRDEDQSPRSRVNSNATPSHISGSTVFTNPNFEIPQSSNRRPTQDSSLTRITRSSSGPENVPEAMGTNEPNGLHTTHIELATSEGIPPELKVLTDPSVPIHRVRMSSMTDASPSPLESPISPHRGSG
jgi:hypothetical protein